MQTVTLSYARTHLSQLVRRVEQGESFEILRRGKPVARLGPSPAGRKAIDVAKLRALTDGMTRQTESAADIIRRMRDEGF